jgi:ketosteroid isomerase-like protein
MSEATTIIRRYIDLVGAHDLAPLGDLLADDLVAATSGGTFTKAEWVAALDRLLPILVRNDIREIFEAGDKAAVFYDFVTNTDAGAVPCAEWITVADGTITTVELIFEQSKWSHVVAALSARRTTG